MVIQCTHCQSRFKLADDKLKPEGTKVRCSKCREVFTVFPDDAAPPPRAAAAPAPAPPPVPEPAPEPEPATPPPPASTPVAPSAEFEFGDDGGESTVAASASGTVASGGDEAAGAIIDEFAFDISDFGSTPATTQTEESTPFQPAPTQAGFGEFDFTAEEQTPSQTSLAPVNTEEQATFGEISFDSPSAEAPPTEEGPAFDEFTFDTPETTTDFTPAPVSRETFAFGEVSDDAFNFDEKPQPPPTSFDFEEETFATSSGGSSGGKAAEPFNFDSLSFGDSAPAPTVAIPGESPTNPPYPPTAPAEAVSLATRPVPAERPERPATPQRPAGASRPMPAIPKPPRYRISPMGVLLRLVFVIFVGICGAVVYFYYQPGAFDIKQYIGDLIGKAATPVEKGRIRLDKLSGSYVHNQHVGDLFVIRGEAVNEFTGPRSAIEVRGALLAKDGKVLRERNAFCGNPLSDKTLRTASFATIEEAMNNQFGDLMSNLKIPAGSAIPFTIVFRNLPAEMAEFTVELVDAKPASN